jgi:hypothetical protein
MEFSWFGDAMPRDAASQREHLKQVEEGLRHEHEADQAALAQRGKPPWWKFWTRQSS